MDKEQVFNKMCDGGLIAVVRAKDSEQAIKIAEACKEGGVAGIEITFTVPGADEVIRALAAKYKNGEILLGAGTVLDAENSNTCRCAVCYFSVVQRGRSSYVQQIQSFVCSGRNDGARSNYGYGGRRGSS